MESVSLRDTKSGCRGVFLSIPMTRLPIDSSLPRIIEELAHRRLVVVAPPGSGKTTRVPVALLKSGLLSLSTRS